MQHLRRHAPRARRRRHHRPADRTIAVADNVDKSLAVERQRHRAAQVRVVERRLVAIDEHLPRNVPRYHLANRLRGVALQFLHQWQGEDSLRKAVEIAACEGQYRGRGVGDEGIFDTVEVRTPLLPIFRVLGHLDRFIRFELDEFEGASADRLQAHVASRHVAGIDR